MARKKISYDEAIQEMERILIEIEEDELDMDSLSKKVKRVSALLDICKAKLRETEQDVENIVNGLKNA